MVGKLDTKINTMQQESYIQYLAGYSKDAVNMQDVKTALADLQGMDDEHGAFWVGLMKEEEKAGSLAYIA